MNMEEIHTLRDCRSLNIYRLFKSQRCLAFVTIHQMSRLNIPEEVNHEQNGCDEVRSRIHGENHKQIFWNLTGIRFRKDRKYDKTFTKRSTDCTSLAQRATYNKNALAPSYMRITFPLTITFYTSHFIMNVFLAFFLS